MDDTGLFLNWQSTFVPASCAVPTLTPGVTRGTKDLSVTAKGSVECLAHTSDIDKAGSQSPCREVNRDTLKSVGASYI